MLRAAKIDSNHAEIVRELKQLPGISVYSTAQLKKFCDIIVGFRNKNYLFEIKVDSKKKLTEGESLFQQNWMGQVNTVTCVEEILEIIGFKLYK
jgi:hypothetical protein